MSFNQQLFLKINSLANRNRWTDMFFVFCAHTLIYFLGFAALLWGAVRMEPELFKLYVKFLLSAMAGSFVLSWILAIIFREHRPITELPQTKLLIHPMQNWKSFPSDHTAMAFIFALVMLLFGFPMWLVVVGFICAFIIAFARIFVGVHYPGDILGGIILALIVTYLAPLFLTYLMQPLYNWLVGL